MHCAGEKSPSQVMEEFNLQLLESQKSRPPFLLPANSAFSAASVLGTITCLATLYLDSEVTLSLVVLIRLFCSFIHQRPHSSLPSESVDGPR